MSEAASERRHHKRRSTQGEITLRMEGDSPLEVRAVLLDISATGFRARHGNLTLARNRDIQFETAGFSGRARVVWNRILGEEVESGFVIIERD